MILFSTISQGWQVWFFCYLGLISGLLFFIVMFCVNFLTKKSKLKIISPKNSQNFHNSSEIYTEKTPKQFFWKKLCTIFTFLWKFFINFATEILAIFVLCGVVMASLLINLHFNYGLLPPICVLFWISSFLLAKFFLKTLAKIFLSIYNKYIKSKEMNSSIS